MLRLIILLNISFLVLYTVRAYSQTTEELRNLINRQPIEASSNNYSPVNTVKVFAEDLYFYKLNNYQIHNAIKEILGLNDDIIINGDGTSVIISTKEKIDDSHDGLNKFCYNKLDGQTYNSNPKLFYTEEGVSYVYCDIKPILQRYKASTKYIINYDAEFNLISLWAGWRNVINSGEQEIYFNNKDSYIYKNPRFFFNGENYYIRARQSNEKDLSARGYCSLKESSDLLPTFGRDSTKIVKNKDVIELNEYGTPISLDYYEQVEVWNTIVCTQN